MRPSVRLPAATRSCGCFWRVIIQIRSQPAFYFLQGHAFADVIIQQLVATKLANGEVFRFRVRKIKPAHAAGGPHRTALGELDTGVLLYIEQFPENFLFRVVGTGGIARRRPDAAILFPDQSEEDTSE